MMYILDVSARKRSGEEKSRIGVYEMTCAEKLILRAIRR